MKLTKKTLKAIIVEEYNVYLQELNACHSKKDGKLSSCASGDSYSLSEPAVKKANWDPDKAGKGKVSSKGNPTWRYGMASGAKACGRVTVPGDNINPKYKCADYPEQYDESGHPLVPSSNDSRSDRLDKLGYSKHLQALQKGIIRADEDIENHADEIVTVTVVELVSIIEDAFSELSRGSKNEDAQAQRSKAFAAKCRQLGLISPQEAQTAILKALNNFNRASDGKLFEPQKS